MNHVQLHALLSETLIRLKAGKIHPLEAKQIFNGSGKLIQNCRNELIAAHMGVPMEIPLLGVSKKESKKLDKQQGGKFIELK